MQTVPGAGPPPLITISDVHWDNTTSTLSFYMDNAGGSGTVTLAIFLDGYSGIQSYHIYGLEATTFTLNFPSYTGSTPPTIQVIQQIPDSGPVPQQVVTWTMMSLTNIYTTAYTMIITQLSTIVSSPTSSQSNPAPSSGPSLSLLILPIVVVVFLALLLLSRRRKPQPGTMTAQKFCTKCGKPIQPDSKFCSGCGASQNV